MFRCGGFTKLNSPEEDSERLTGGGHRSLRRGGSVKLLVVDDDSELCGKFRAFFEREGFVPEFENDGGAGLDRALAEPFDLVLLDVVLPSIDGFEVLRRLRERSDVPVLMLTAGGEQWERVR